MQLRRTMACWLGMLLAANSTSAFAGEPATADTVVLLHGLGRTRWSMTPLANRLSREGYRVVNVSYPSRTTSPESLAREWLPAILDTNVHPRAKVHFVTHSLGGILVRLWLRDQATARNVGRVVMLAPPNRGSEVSDRLRRLPVLAVFTGPNLHRLGTDPLSLPTALGHWHNESIELGVIAGNRSLNPLFSSWLPGPDDGKVTVASTHLTGERDHVVLPYSHTWLPARRATADAVISFLRHGTFPRPARRGFALEKEQRPSRTAGVPAQTNPARRDASLPAPFDPP